MRLGYQPYRRMDQMNIEFTQEQAAILWRAMKHKGIPGSTPKPQADVDTVLEAAEAGQYLLTLQDAIAHNVYRTEADIDAALWLHGKLCWLIGQRPCMKIEDIQRPRSWLKTRGV
jgi:hypothetical protein